MQPNNGNKKLTEGLRYLRGNKTNVKPVTISQDGKPKPKPIKPSNKE
jgi:hypothetical protein